MENKTKECKLLLLILLITSLSFQGWSQPIASLDPKNRGVDKTGQRKDYRPLQSVLAEITSLYNVKFNYDPDLIKNKVVDIKNVELRKGELDKFLVTLLNQIQLDFEKVKEDDYIIFKKRNYINSIEKKEVSQVDNSTIYTADLNSSITYSKENRRISNSNSERETIVTGKIVNLEDNEPLPGVSVVIKGTTIGTVTDADGEYSLSVEDPNAILVFSSIGFNTEEIPVNGRTKIDLSMAADIESLQEVVVVGYGQVKKSDVTGSVAKVTAEKLQSFPVQNTVQALQGRAPGVDITSNSRPGEAGMIRIRGNRSIAASNDPLYVVDGIPLQSGGIESFNPNDIESIEVLKDASASAIYGSRAANGVVLVTTKKGKAGKTQVNYSGSVYLEKINDLVEMFDGGEYAEFRRNAYRSYPAGNASRYNTLFPNPADDKRILGNDPYAWESIAAGYNWVDKDNLVPEMRPTTEDEKARWGVDEVPVYDPSRVRTTDWTKYVERTGITQDHNLSINMGTEKFKGYISGGYLDQKGTNVGQDYKRYSATINLDLQATKWLKVGGSVLSTYGIQNYGYAGTGSRDARTIYDAAKGMLPFAVPYDDEGNFIFQPGGDVNIINPIEEANNVINERKTLRIFGSFFGEVQLMDGLKFRANFGPDFRNYQNGEFQYKESVLRGGGAPTSTNYARSRQEQHVAWTQENLLFYDKTFADIHKVGVTLLQSSSMQKNDNTDMSATNLPYNSQLWYNLGSTQQGALQGWGSGYSKRTLLSYMARVNYTLLDKYLLTLTGRWDGASVLATGNKWDFFPSFAIAWKLKEEPFLQNVTWLSELKPRVGMGTVGQQSVNPYTTLGGLIQVPYVFGATPANGYVPADPKGDPNARGIMPNPQLSWEKTQNWNFGIDFGFFNNRVEGSVDYYFANTFDLIMNKQPIPIYGYPTINENIGQTQNSGIEIGLSTVNVRTNRFKWTTDAAFSINNNKIIELANGKNDNVNSLWFINEPISVFYDYNKIGVWQIADEEEMQKFNANGSTYKAGDIRVEDLNGDYKIDATNDRKIIGTPYAKWTLGLTNTFNYRNFELSAFVYSRWGQTIQGGGESMQGRFASRKIDYWTPENPTNEYPRADFGNGGQPVHGSTLNYQDGSFVKVRYISLGYVFPTSWVQRAHLSNVKLYAQVLNPFLYSKVDFLDPDVVYQNPDRNFQTQFSSGISSRSLVFGLNVTF
jgi:TonB-dependent starch-binding outer membrane protein SusC